MTRLPNKNHSFVFASDGFTLIELIIVIALIAILSGIGTFQFTQYSRKSAIEKQTKTLYGDLMELRSKSIFEKKSRGLRLTATGYSIYSSATMTVNPVETKTLTVPITWNNSADIILNNRGFVQATLSSVCTTNANSANVDSLVVSESRIRMGKLKEGTTCGNTANIDAR